MGDALAAHIRFAQGEGPPPEPSVMRELVTAISTVNQAARGRVRLEANRPLSAGSLAALGGVSTRHIRRLVREERLARAGTLITCEAARAWLQRGAARIVAGFKFYVSPRWWGMRYNFGWVRERLLNEAKKMVPAECEVVEGAGDQLVLVVSARAAMTREQAEELRLRITARFDQLDPGPGANWRPPEWLGNEAPQ
jgi:hypothetical protein